MRRRQFLTAASSISAAGALSATLPAPAIAQSRKEMVVVSSWGRDFPGVGTGAQRLAKRIEEVSNGSFKVNYFAAGERVGAFDVFDAVADGNAQAYISAEYYWKGKHPGFAFFTSVPFGLTYTEMSAWIHHMGGQDLWDKLSADYGIKCIPAGNSGVQMGGWFNKEIESAEDLKGLKVRMPGLGGDVMAKLGASPVSLPGGQIYENLISGAIDAAEWVGPWNDYFMKFYEAAKYYYYPGMHEPGGFASFGFNASWWSSLQKSEQAMLTAVAQAENDHLMAEFNANNGIYLDKLIDEHGVNLRRFNDDVYDAFGRAAQEVFILTRDHSSLAREICDSFVKARTDVGRWKNLSEASYYTQRNRVLGVQ